MLSYQIFLLILIFTSQSREEGIEVRYEDETIWLTQKLMAALFDVSLPTINEHLKNIFTSEEINHVATIRKFRIVQKEGKREISREIEFYNLDVIISVGYRVNSKRATQFRQWAKRLDLFLEFADREILKDPGKITAKIAKEYAESEFEKYRIIQDHLFESDFDKIIKQIDPKHAPNRKS